MLYYKLMIDQKVRQRVFELIKAIPPGKVATYKQIATLAGLKNPRQVGHILRTDPAATNYPCHRVIHADGTVADGTAFGERFGQIVRLRQEGVVFRGRKVKLDIFGWIQP
jgi:methylated-DNA-protein-cysteine methyltransferase-like protein